MKCPTPNSGEQYSTEDVFNYIGSALPEAAVDVDVGRHGDIVVTYDGMNRREVFVHLLKHGWGITSVDTTEGQTRVWLERLDDATADGVTIEYTNDVKTYSATFDTLHGAEMFVGTLEDKEFHTLVSME
jgi:hypothetical protein